MMQMMKQLRKRTIVILITCAAIMAMGIIAGAIYFMQKSPYEISGELRSQPGFDIILPSRLPIGAEILEQPSYDKQTKLVTTKIQLNAGSVIFSQQKNPGVDLKQVDAKETYLTNVGSVYVLKGEKGRLQAIVETSDSWVIVNSAEKNGAKVFREVIDSLAAV